MLQLNPEDLGKQLRCPSGEHAKQIGENMFLSNSNMIFKAIDSLEIQSNSFVLEIGFGNGKHLSYLFNKNKNLNYTGVDISQEMAKEAIQNNIELVRQKLTDFLVVKPNERLSFPNQTFDYCFTVNTIYFIENLTEYFCSVFEVLKPNGKIAIGFIAKEFGEKLMFTQQGFTFYFPEEIKHILSEVGFNSIKIITLTEDTLTKDRQRVNRPFCVVTAQK